MSSDTPDYQLRPETQRHCPNCNVRLPQNAVLCVDCGFDLRSGGFVATEPIVQAGDEQSDVTTATRIASIAETVYRYVSTFLLLLLLVGLVAGGIYYSGIIRMPLSIVGSWKSKQMSGSTWVFAEDGTFEIRGLGLLIMTDPVAGMTRRVTMPKRGRYAIEERKVKDEWVLRLDRDGGTELWAVRWANRANKSLYLRPSLNPREPFGFILYPSEDVPKPSSRSSGETQSSTAEDDNDVTTKSPNVASPPETTKRIAGGPSTVAGVAPTGATEGDGPPQSRVWFDNSGEFRIEATFVSSTTDTVVLRKADGALITVPIDRLGDEERKWIELRVE